MSDEDVGVIRGLSEKWIEERGHTLVSSRLAFGFGLIYHQMALTFSFSLLNIFVCYSACFMAFSYELGP